VPEVWELTWRKNGRRARRAFFERSISNMESFIIKLGTGMVEYPNTVKVSATKGEGSTERSRICLYYQVKKALLKDFGLICACQLLCLEKREDCLFGYSWLALMIVIGF
jgi:hypothetical protein